MIIILLKVVIIILNANAIAMSGLFIDEMATVAF